MRKDSTAYGAERAAWDKQDCSVRALAVATAVPYEVASMVFSVRGRRLKACTPTDLSRELYEQVLGMRAIEMAEGMTLSEFTQMVLAGRFIVHKRGHAFAVIDGVVHDWENTTNPSTRIERVWKVTEKAQAKMAVMANLV